MRLSEAAENVVQLKPDAVLAKELREEIEALLAPVCQTIDRARKAGLVVSFGIVLDQYGRTTVQNFSIVKPL